MSSEEIKIRTLPRGPDKKKEGKEKPKGTPRWIIYVGTTSVLLLAVTFLYTPHKKRGVVAAHQTSLASTSSEINDLVTRHLQDAEIKHTMMQHTREMENLQFRDAANEPKQDDVLTLPDNHSYGVQMDTEDSAARVYDDLNEDPAKYSDSLPTDKINSRLARRKWLNEQEREAKIAFIRDYIRSAYDRGYEVDINQDLVVVGVRRITGTRKLNINQVIDRLAKQGDI